MADVKARVLWQNFIKNGATIVSASSEQSSQPARWLKDQVRSDPWRSKLGWTPGLGVTDHYDFTEGSDKRVAVPSLANYVDGVSYAAALQTALNGAGIDPSSLSPTGWYKADTIDALDGALLATWVDSSGGSRNLTQSTDAKKPTFKRSVLNGRPAVLFDGSRELSSSAALSTFITAGAGTIFIVFYEDPTSSGTRQLVKDRNAKAGIGIDDSNVVFANDDGALDTTSKANTEGVWHIACWQHSGGNVLGSLNDHDSAAQGSTASGDTSDLTGVLDVGHRASAQWFKGYVAELIIFNTALSEENRRRITKYLLNKFAILNDTTTAPTWTNTYTVTYSGSTKKFTVARSAGAATISLDVTSGPNLVRNGWKDVGFTSNKTGSTSYTSDVEVYQSRHYLDADLKTALGVQAGVVLSHNVSAGTAKLISGASYYALLTATPVTLAGDTITRIAYFSQDTKRFWRLFIDDVSNSLGYAEVGVWFIGPYTEPTQSYAPQLAFPRSEYSNVTFSDHGAPYMDDRPSGRGWDLTFHGIDINDLTAWQNVAAYVKIGRCFIMAFDVLNVTTNVAYVLCTTPIDLGHVAGRLYRANVKVIEAVQ